MTRLRTCLIAALLLHQSLGDDDFFFNRRSRQVISDDEDILDGSGSEELPVDPPITTTSKPPTSRSSYVFIKVCGKNFYCPIASRGPCGNNELLAIDEESRPNNSTDDNNLSCSLLSNYPWAGCVPSKQAGRLASTSPAGRCVLKSAEEPCSGYPTHFRYHPLKKSCQPISLITGKWLVNSCGDDQVFVRVGKDLGYCRCRNQRHLPFAGDNRCYHPHTKGTCDAGFWLEQSTGQQLYCLPCPCPDLADGLHIFWNGGIYGTKTAGCYRSFTRGPCPEGNTFIIDDFIKGRGRCHTYWSFLSL